MYAVIMPIKCTEWRTSHWTLMASRVRCLHNPVYSLQLTSGNSDRPDLKFTFLLK
jgi:hypothetical protein